MTNPKYMRPGLDFAVGKAMEECGELVSALGKTMRWGWDSVNPELPPDQQETNRDWVRREIDDVRGALNNLVAEMNKAEITEIKARTYMTETRDAFAKRLNGREYRSELTRAEEAEAKAARLLIVFGASDDLTEFQGIISDEVGAGKNTEHRIVMVRTGRWIVTPSFEEDGKPITHGVAINAQWCPDGFDGSWLITPSVPHASFDIMEDGELYCRGAVIDETDLLPAQRVVEAYVKIGEPTIFIARFTEALTHADIFSLDAYLRDWSR